MARFPLIIASFTGPAILPSFTKKLFLAIPEKSPLLEGCPPEYPPTIIPFLVSLIISSIDFFPASTTGINDWQGAGSKPDLLDAYKEIGKALSSPSLITS